MRGALLLVLLAGCAVPDLIEVPPREPLCWNEGFAPPPPPESAEVAALKKKLAEKIGEADLVALALARNPDLDVLRQERAAARARLYQAGLYAYNPSVFAGVDDLKANDHHPQTGEGPYPGKIQGGVSQQIEFPTKRGSRIELGEALVRAADSDFEAKERDVRTSVRSTFVDVLAAQDRFAVATKNHEIAARLHDAAVARVAASAAPPIEETKAEADELRARNDAKAAERDVALAKAQLAQLLGDPALAIGALDGALLLDGPELAFEGAKPIDRHPALVSKGHAVDAAAANLEVQKRAALPDPTFSFTYNRNRGDTDTLTANVSIPLPILNANQGAIRDAALAIDKASSDLQSTRAALVTAYHQAISSYETARANARVIREKTLPATEKALALAEEGWKAGKFRYLDVLDAERSLTAARADYVTALQDLNRAIIQIEGLTGKRVDELAR